MSHPRAPLAACAVVVAALAVMAATASGCKSKAPEEGVSQAESGPERTILAEGLPDEAASRIETGIMTRELDRYAGEMDEKNRYVATVMITTGEPMDSVECSGVLLSPRLVLTAASCLCSPRTVATPELAERVVIDGSECARDVAVTTATYGEVLDRKYKEATTQVEFQTYKGKVRPHPEFELRLDASGGVVSGRADLATVLLDQPMAGGPAGIPLADAEVQGEEQLIMAGYARDGQQQFGGYWRVRYYRRNKVESVSPGGRVLYAQQGPFLYNGYMGGPCIRERGQERTLVGVASVDSDSQLSFTSTYVFKDWLSAEMRRAVGRGAAAPGRSGKRE